MKHKLLSTLLIAAFAMFSTGLLAQTTDSKSSVPSAQELEKIATTTEKGMDALAKLVDAIDLSFLMEIDSTMKKEDVPFTRSDKEAVKAELQKGADAVNDIDFKKVENFLKQIESVVINFDPEDFLKDGSKTKKKEEK